MTTLTPTPKQQFLDANGNPLAGGKVYSYAAGTTTPLVTYTGQSGSTPNTNPVILDSRGEAAIWLGVASYKLKLTTAADAEIWTVDNIVSSGVQALADLSEAGGSALVGYLPAGTGAVTTTVQAKLRETISVKDFGAVGNGVANDTAAIQAAITASVGKSLLLPKGTYLINGTLSLPSDTYLVGEGWQSIVYLASGTNSKIFTNSDISGGNVNIWLESFAINGNSAGQTGGSFVTGIDFTKVTGFKLNNLYVHHTREIPIFIREGSDFEITGCFTEYAQGATYPGMYVGYSGTGAVNGAISNCYSNNNGQDGILVQLGTNVRVENCSAKNNGQSGIKLGAPSNCIVSNSYAEGNVSGFRGQGINNCTYIGNIAYRNKDSGFTIGLDAVTSRNVFVIGNQSIENGQAPTSTSYGVSIDYQTTGSLTNLYIKNNSCVDNQGTKTQTRGISLNTSGATYSNIVVDGNTCIGNSVSDFFSNISAVIFKDAGNIGFTGSSTIPFLYPTTTVQLQFWADNIPASSGTVFANDGASSRGFVMPRAGYFRAIYAKGNAACTAGSCTFQTRVNGTGNSLNATINTTNTTFAVTNPTLRSFSFAAGDYIQVAYVSDASFLPAGTTDYNIVIEVVY